MFKFRLSCQVSCSIYDHAGFGCFGPQTSNYRIAIHKELGMTMNSELSRRISTVFGWWSHTKKVQVYCTFPVFVAEKLLFCFWTRWFLLWWFLASRSLESNLNLEFACFFKVFTGYGLFLRLHQRSRKFGSLEKLRAISAASLENGYSADCVNFRRFGAAVTMYSVRAKSSTCTVVCSEASQPPPFAIQATWGVISRRETLLELF